MSFIKKGDASDSSEYDIVVLDPGYTTYLASQPPMNFHSKEYYRSWNVQYVTEWNRRHNSSRSDKYATYINYDLRTDYGLEFEYKLYYFFRFFEESNRVRLLNRGR